MNGSWTYELGYERREVRGEERREQAWKGRRRILLFVHGVHLVCQSSPAPNPSLRGIRRGHVRKIVATKIALRAPEGMTGSRFSAPCWPTGLRYSDPQSRFPLALLLLPTTL